MSNIYKEVFLAALTGFCANSTFLEWSQSRTDFVGNAVEWAGITANEATENPEIMAKIREAEGPELVPQKSAVREAT